MSWEVYSDDDSGMLHSILIHKQNIFQAYFFRHLFKNLSPFLFILRKGTFLLDFAFLDYIGWKNIKEQSRDLYIKYASQMTNVWWDSDGFWTILLDLDIELYNAINNTTKCK